MDDPRARRPAGSDSRGAKSDGKGFGKARGLPTSFLCIGGSTMKPSLNSQSVAATTTTTSARPEVIAIRKSCDAEGTGLSHYVLMDKQVKQ